jgi:Zn-dependent peptidase ImmA (M78 family)
MATRPNGNDMHGSSDPDFSQFGGKTSFDIINPFLEGAPVNLDGMAAALGLKVFDADTFHNDEAGRISRVFDNDQILYVIEINSRHSENRKRFTLAHEISHYLLHRDRIGNGITDDALYRSKLGEYIETEANRLAAQLLMPRVLVRSLFKSGIQSLVELCNKFQVSEAAMRIRLKQLRLDA